MAFISVDEAARQLGVSNQRVYALLRDGRLEGERMSREWMVDQASVKTRLLSGSRPGRPAKHQQILRKYTLMSKNYPVLDFEYDEGAQKFLTARTIHDPARTPIGLLSPREAFVTGAALSNWWHHRIIPTQRHGIKAKLKQLGFEDYAQLAFASLGFSLTDQYWVRPASAPELKWEDLNFFTNPFDEAWVESESDDELWLASVGLHSPDNTSDGMLPKRWICEDGKRILLKGGSGIGRQEPFNEVVATALHRRVLQPHEFVPYELRQLQDRWVSACECFVQPNEEFIPAWHIMQSVKKSNNDNDFTHLLKCCERIGAPGMKEAIAKTLLTDYVLANEDRHFRNFGVVRNVDTLEMRPGPIFDTGSCLWFDTDFFALQHHNYKYKSKPFYELPQRQLLLFEDFAWCDGAALDGFAQEAAEILQQSDLPAERVELVARGIERQIENLRYHHGL